jgi:hypothetical protein
VRNIEELEWRKMINSIKIGKKLSEEEISTLAHGYKLLTNEGSDSGEF